MLITEVTGCDLDDERLTPNLLADSAKALLVELVPLRDAAKSKGERKRLSSRIKSARILLHFARTRAGYVAKPGEKVGKAPRGF